ncbi:response regulator [Haliovirga abyssi]|uniref:DNA-binding response regulator n=1 Tax=Haliovirga abyssi TaxID=2996794 RepID=A0AAU9DGA4_9FUSO|nr:response regulator transcription factor [Haliovirga abyssi]BDU49709.1 DNA-binding response regulator [Haliovirga abyssi]
MKNVLIVEDESAMRKIIKDYLIRDNFRVFEAEDGEKAIDMFYSQKIDLIILDIMIPGYDGWSICRRIREDSTVPIIMLTARSAEEDEIFGLELGADEYITKPFSPKVLMARIKNIFRRVENSDNENGNTEFGELKINNKSHQVYLENKELKLSPKEYELLLFFSENKDKAISREEILNKIWGYDYFGDLRTIDTHIKRLRKKLNGKFIITVRGTGYRFEVEE